MYKRGRRGGLARRLGFGLCAAMFLVTGSLWARDILRGAAEQAANTALAQQVHAAEAAETTEAMQGAGEDGILPQYAALWEQNHDLAGWLSIPGTAVDYPVMFTPEEPEYYLHRAFDGSAAASGSLFIGQGSSPENSHVIVYGHHMKNGSMFSSLVRYAERDYGREHPTISFDTLDAEGAYQLLAAFYSRIYAEGEEGFRYYAYTDLSDADTFAEYVRLAKENALYDTGVDAVYGDRLLTLSTCSYHTEEGRFVVVARRMGPAAGGADGEQ